MFQNIEVFLSDNFCDMPAQLLFDPCMYILLDLTYFELIKNKTSWA